MSHWRKKYNERSKILEKKFENEEDDDEVIDLTNRRDNKNEGESSSKRKVEKLIVVDEEEEEERREVERIVKEIEEKAIQVALHASKNVMTIHANEQLEHVLFQKAIDKLSQASIAGSPVSSLACLRKGISAVPP